MSQVTLPWLAPDAEARSGYRRKAILLLLSIGLPQILVTAATLALTDVNVPNRMNDWRILQAFFLVSGLAVGVVAMAGAFAVTFYRQIGAILQRGYTAATIFFGGVISVCLIVWFHAWIFDVIVAIEAGPHNDPAITTILSGELSAREVYRGIEHAIPVPLVAYLLWPLQFPIVRDLLATAGVIGFISIIPGFGIWWERKVAGRIQSRLGPMRVGGWHGWAQSPADGIKLLFKEDLIPEQGDRILFRMAPHLVLIPVVCLFLALPFAGSYVFRDLDVALLFILAMLGIEVVGVILAGWASNNKWSMYGAMREACQMVSYEIPMGMALLIPVMMAGSLQLTTIANAQSGSFADWFVFRNPWCFIAFFIYFTAALASCKRAPFDLPESESELVAGFLTEYSGFRWSLFFFAEYAAMFAVCGLAVILFLGGWKSPLPASWAAGLDAQAWYTPLVKGLFFEGPILFVLKAAFMFYVQLWVRWTLPRVRIDQVLYGCIQVLLPLMMGVLLINTLWILAIDHLEWAWLKAIDTGLHYALVAIGVFTLASIVFIAGYGYVNRRRLPGPLVIEHLPGS